jgi:hypothetical protein
MLDLPLYPSFKPVALEDRDFLQPFIWRYQPETSELTFTNLFIWQTHYGFEWSVYRHWVFIVATRTAGDAWALQPIGPPPRLDISRMLLRWLRDEKGSLAPRIERADRWFAREMAGENDLRVEPVRDHFDYLYSTRALIELTGRDYHAKRNHINAFTQTTRFSYAPLTEPDARACLELADTWCAGRCEDDLGLLGEWEAVARTLVHFEALPLAGGMILIEGQVKAFSVGELLNSTTVVIHIEKADPAVRGLYPMINQQFLEKAWSETLFVNREQDLGNPGLRRAKESYYPARLIEKLRISLIETR